MKLELLQPRQELKPYISKMWVFESNGRLPDEDMKLIVPNGLFKRVIPVHNGLSGKYKDYYTGFPVYIRSSLDVILHLNTKCRNDQKYPGGNLHHTFFMGYGRTYFLFPVSRCI